MAEAQWDVYYQKFIEKKGHTFASHKESYFQEINRFFPSREPLNVLVGGVAGFFSADKILESWREIRPEIKDKIVFFDQNISPLRQIDQNEKRIVGRLQEFPFAKESFDLIILDFTLDFLSDKELKDFFAQSSKSLSKKGKIIALVDLPFSFKRENIRVTKEYKVPFYSRNAEKYEEFARPFLDMFVRKLTESADIGKSVEVLVFSPAIKN